MSTVARNETRALGSTSPPRPLLMLALATVGFAVNFWAWALLSPLGPRFKDLLGLSGSQQALIVAVPVIVGSEDNVATIAMFMGRSSPLPPPKGLPYAPGCTVGSS